MCEQCGPYIDERPTPQELAYERWLEQECYECGDKQPDCCCEPGCSCDESVD